MSRCPPGIPGAPGSWSGDADVRRLGSLGALTDRVGDLLVLLEGAVAGAGDRREMDEHVGAATVRRDEAEALLGVEPFGCGSSGGTSCGSWNGAVEVAGLVDALLFLTEVPCPVGVEVAVAVEGS